MKKLIFTLLATFIIILPLFAKSEFENKLNIRKYPEPLKMPRKYSVITDELDISASHKDDFSHDLWIVLSDRDNNITYENSDFDSKKLTKIHFLEAFYVAAEKDDYLLLAKGNLKRGKFHKKEIATSYGWIHKRNLILSKHSLKDKNHIYRKALVINSIDQIEKILDRDNLNSLAYRSGPSDSYAERDTSRVFNIYFVLKTNKTMTKSATMFLLARKSLLYSVGDLETIKQANEVIILGWIPASSVTPWNHRIALEQNWEIDAVKQRKKYGTPAEIFLDQEKLATLMKNKKIVSISEKTITLLSDDKYYKAKLRNLGKDREQQADALKSFRLDGYNMRYPIVENYGDDIYSVGFIGDVYISRLKKLTAMQEAEGQKILHQLKNEYQYTNIVFVVDATNSMTPYLKTVSQAIQEAMTNLSENDNIKFGGVIFRDGDDEIPNSKELTSSFWEVAEYFNNEKGMSKQPSFAESMYSGIILGLDDTGFRAGQNNCLVLISDVGNHREKELQNEEKIARLINKYNCNFLAIQVNRKARYDSEKQANDDFYLQNTRIIHKSIVKSGLKMKLDKIDIPIPGLEKNSTKEYSATGPLFLGKVLPIEVGKLMKKETLKQFILTFINSAERNSDLVLRNLDDIAQGKGIEEDKNIISGQGSDFSRDDLSQLTINMMKLANLDLNIVDNIKEKRFQLYVNGLIKNRFKLLSDKLSEPLFKKVILISANDMRRLHTIFGECFNDEFRQCDPDNIRLAEGWKEFLGKLSGNFSPEQQKSLKEFNQKTIAELTEMSFGIPSNSKFAELNLNDILEFNPMISADKEIIEDLKQHIRTKYEILDQEVLNKGDSYKFSFYIDDVLYYWISADDLP
ncbi:MAG: hypothetical protein K8S23_01470 [Candidatus Cloacimonetes bacterium]|nr:hypothetical protein [Candidatus Cloacimonadota bacterium]